MLRDEIRARMLAAMKAGERLEKDILKLALGEIQTAEARGGGDLDDEAVSGILRKLVKSNGESRDASEDAGTRAKLEAEIAILESLLPQTLRPEEIEAALGPVRDAILAAGNDGQATGIAMKHLKGAGATVTGQDVARAVKAMRGA